MLNSNELSINILKKFKCSDMIEFRCTVCNRVTKKRKSYIIDTLKVKPAVYCSRVCSSKIYNPLKTSTVKCATCNTDIIKPLAYIERHKTPFYCSVTCSNFAKPKKTVKQPKYRHGVTVTWNCKECDKPVTTIPSKQRKYCSRECAYKNAYHPNSTKVHRCIYNGIKLDSGAELAFAKILDQNKIKWYKNTKQYFLFTDSYGKLRKYYPDFYLEEYDWWVEIKGKKYQRQDDELRLKAVGNITKLDSQDLNIDFIKNLAPTRRFEPR